MAEQMTEYNLVNGIDVDAMEDAVELVRENPPAGQFTFRARNRWSYGAHCCTTIQDFTAGGHEDATRPKPFVMEADEPTILLGEDNAANATEAVLHALASCLNASFVYQAAARGITVEHLELELEGKLDIRGFLGIDESVRNGYQNVHATFRVIADASDEQIRELCEMAQRRSPVFDIVSHGVPVSVGVEVLGHEEGETATSM